MKVRTTFAPSNGGGDRSNGFDRPAGTITGRAFGRSATGMAFCSSRMSHERLGAYRQWFAVDKLGVVPDVITTAKGLTSVSAVGSCDRF